MLDNQNHIDSLILRSVQGQCEPEEILELRNWINDDKENLKAFHQIQNLWNTIEVDKNITELDVHEKWLNLEQKIKPANSSDINDNKRSNTRNFYQGKFFIAASIFILGFVIAFTLFKIIPQNNDEQEFSEITTPMGSRTLIHLSDGSKVWLNAGSTFTYPDKFNKNNREVFLEGEAYFQVSKNRNKEFLVNTEDFLIKVYGTEFNVKSYPEDETSEATLVEGAISVTKKKIQKDKKPEEILLKPNQRLVLYKRSTSDKGNNLESIVDKNVMLKVKPKDRIVLSKGIETNKYVSWKEGELNIQSETMEDLAIKLERRYNIRIKFDQEEIKKFAFSGIITNETLEQVMNAIKLSSQIDYEIEERIVTLRLDPVFKNDN